MPPKGYADVRFESAFGSRQTKVRVVFVSREPMGFVSGGYERDAGGGLRLAYSAHASEACAYLYWRCVQSRDVAK